MKSPARLPPPDEFIERAVTAHAAEIQRLLDDSPQIRTFCRELVGFARWKKQQALASCQMFNELAGAYLKGCDEMPNYLADILAQMEGDGE